MDATDVDVASLSPPSTRSLAEPEKLRRMGSFDWNKYTPIIVEKSGERLIIQDGLTCVEAARRAGISQLPAYMFEEK